MMPSTLQHLEVNDDMQKILGILQTLAPGNEEVQEQVDKLNFFTQCHYYTYYMHYMQCLFLNL